MFVWVDLGLRRRARGPRIRRAGGAHAIDVRQVPASGERQTPAIVRDLAYLTRLHREPSPLLLELEQHGLRDGIPIVDRAAGRLLSVLVHSMQANRILEIGTAYGYSTLWMALALPPAGKIWTIDPDIERTDIAASYFRRAGVAERVEIINSPALEVLEASRSATSTSCSSTRSRPSTKPTSRRRCRCSSARGSWWSTTCSGRAARRAAQAVRRPEHPGAARLQQGLPPAPAARRDDRADRRRNRHRCPRRLMRFKAAMRRFATGVAIVTTVARGAHPRLHRQRLRQRLAPSRRRC